jgi:TM2 domain-containing membrane protein YozV
MNRPLKAALLSALIFPGAGQFFLKKYISAVYFAAFAGVGLYLLFSNLMVIAQDIIDKAHGDEVENDLAAILELVHLQLATAIESFMPALIILLVAWIVSAVEAYRVAKKEENTREHGL